MKLLMLCLLGVLVLAGCKTQDPNKLYFTRVGMPACELTTDNCGPNVASGMCCKSSGTCGAPPADMKGPMVLVSATPTGSGLACGWTYR